MTSSIRHIITIGIFLFAFKGFSQSAEIIENLRIADSLGLIEQLDDAQLYLDSVIENLDPETIDYELIKLKLLLKKAYFLLYNNREDSAAKICLEVIDNGSIEKYPQDVIMAHISLELIHEFHGDYKSCRKRLDLAEEILLLHPQDSMWTIFHIRKSSYYRCLNSADSNLLAIEQARLCLASATKFNDLLYLADAHLILGIVLSSDSTAVAINHYKKAADYNHKLNRLFMESVMHNNIASLYLRMDSLDLGLQHNDTALYWSKKSDSAFEHIYTTRYHLYKSAENYDSALFYLESVNQIRSENFSRNNAAEVKRITASYEDEKKEEIINSQKEKVKRRTFILIFSIIFLLVLALISFLLYRANRKLKLNSIEIEQQKNELKQSVEQKDLLLAEIHHRVKNNLQTIIGMLEFQNLAVESKSIGQITSETQNRIKSLAFLHDKIYVQEGNQFVNFEHFLTDIITLFSNSHSHPDKDIRFEIDVNSINLSIDQSIPLGLILVELITNSYKYAFTGMNEGVISISISAAQEKKHRYNFNYQDTGIGMDLDKKKTGLGHEIINGLAKQLKGKIILSNNIGVEINIYF